MSHTYANLNTFKEYLADGASTGGGTAVLAAVVGRPAQADGGVGAL